MEVRVATRGSRLSIAQTEIALEYMRRALPGARFRVVTVKTTGDVVRDKPLYEIGVKGVFEREVNRAVLEGRADLAVHSLKDVPSDLGGELEIVFLPPRGPPNDALVSRRGVSGLEDLGEGSVVGTSSVRRIAMVKSVNPGLEVKPIRGNLDTRLRKLGEGLYDAIIVAEAGLLRLGAGVDYARLPLVPFTPAPGQGVIAVVGLAGSSLARALSRSSHRETAMMVEAERSFLEAVRAGCHVPVGGVSVFRGGSLRFIASVLSRDGSRASWVMLEGHGRPSNLGRAAGEEVLSLMGDLGVDG